jgi:hypothetical protein
MGKVRATICHLGGEERLPGPPLNAVRFTLRAGLSYGIQRRCVRWA